MELSDPDLVRTAVLKLQEGADGMILWVKFQLEALKSIVTT